MLKQYFNWSSISSLISNIRNPHIILPHLKVKAPSKINYKYLKALGFKAIIFDKDNTLTKPYDYDLNEEIKLSLESCIEVFSDKGVVIFSNTAGNSDDAKNGYKDAKIIESKIGVKVIRHEYQKPEGIEDVKKHFKDFCSPEEIVVIGDRYFTDILFGNSMGSLTIKTDIITPYGENSFVKMARKFEDFVVDSLEKRGIKAKPHRLIINEEDLESILIKD